MRVLFIMSAFPPGPGFVGGAEISAYHTCRGLMRAGIDCSVLVLNNRIHQACDEWSTLDGIPVHRRFFDRPQRSAWCDLVDWGVVRAVVAEIRQVRPDIVHVHNVSGATLAPFVACRALGVPVVNTLHDHWLLCPNNMCLRDNSILCDPAESRHTCGTCMRGFDFWSDVPYRKQVFAALTAHVQRFIAPSQALVDLHVRAGYAPRRFQVVRLGFDMTLAAGGLPPAVVSYLATAYQYQTVVYAGGIQLTKGPHLLLAAIPTLLSHVERLRVVILGPMEDDWRARFERFGPAVMVLGRVPFKAMRAIFAVADLTVLPSIWLENAPVTIYENFDVGTPVVGAAIGGIPELIHEGETGYLFPPGQPSFMAAQIIAHFARPMHERRAMRQRCYSTARTRLTFQQHIAGIRSVYDSVLSQ